MHLRLNGDLVRLEALSPAHAAHLSAAAGEDRSTFGLAAVPEPDGVDAYVAERMSLPDLTPFAQVRVADGRAVGVTCFLNHRRRSADADPYAVEIGGTWLAPSAQRTGVNREAKRLLLTHAFDVWGCGRVDIKTDARNERTRTAIERLGATFEGVLRQWQPSQKPGEEHLLRDTAMYSIVADEWPAVKAALGA